MSNLSTHPIFLGYNWLKKHNPQIDWKVKTLQFICDNEHVPGLLDPEIDDKEVEPEQLFMIDYEYFRNLSTNIAIAAGESKQAKHSKKLFLKPIMSTKMYLPRKCSTNFPCIGHGTTQLNSYQEITRLTVKHTTLLQLNKRNLMISWKRTCLPAVSGHPRVNLPLPSSLSKRRMANSAPSKTTRN